MFQKALALEPNSLAAQMNLGMALRESGETERALVHLRRVAAGDPDNAGVHYELGQTLRQSGDLAGAVAAFEKALELDPEMREAYYGARAALKQQSASARAPRVAADESCGGSVQARAGGRRAWRSSTPPAISSPRRIRLDEKHAEARNLLGFILGQQGELTAAVGAARARSRARPRVGRGALQPRRRAVVQRRQGQGA